MTRQIVRLPNWGIPAMAAAVALWLGGGDCAAQSRGLLREVYTDVPGYQLEDLLASEKFPDFPDSTNLVQEFEAPTDVLDYYGQRLRGYVVAPLTGSYVFWIASDDQSVLYLSSDESPAAKVDIASVPGWTTSREWGKYPSQESGAIYLEAGRLYYVEALMKEGRGGDNLAVRWRLPSGTIEEPIPEPRLVPWGTVFGPPVIVSQPSDLQVVEGQPATFTVRASNPDPIQYQWRRTGRVIPEGTNASYTIPAARLTDHGARFQCDLQNSLGRATSREAVLSVTGDSTPPSLVAAFNIGLSSVVVTYSEPVEFTSAQNPFNYRLEPSALIRSATISQDSKQVTLAVSDLILGATYVLTVNNVQDQAAARNSIAPGSQIAFVASEFAPLDVGNPPLAGSVTVVPGGFDVLADGLGIGAHADQIHFSYQKRDGDFDVKVRIQSLELAGVWAMAGLMARETLETNSPFAGVLATPSISGTVFAWRVSTNASATSASFPVNYPQTWVRLKRTGDTFAGYTGFDGQSWYQLGLITNTLPRTIYLGLAVSSRMAGRRVSAQFRDLAEVVGGTITTRAPEVEPMGPSSRRTGLVLSEIMYHPRARADGANLEFVELFNSQPTSENISGYRLTGSADFTFPPGAVIPAGGFVVVAAAPADLRAVYGLPQVYGPYTNNLPNDAGTVRLRDRLGSVLLEVDYSGEAPWPASADGAGHSLVLARPSYGEGNVAAWAASARRGGSPGAWDACWPEPLAAVKINEFLAHTDDPVRDFIELYNAGSREVDLSGAFLSDEPQSDRFAIPAGTKIRAGGFVTFTQDELGFALTSAGEAIYLVNPSQTRVVDAVRFGAQANGVTMGRYPDGAPGFYPLQSRTGGGPNAAPVIPDIVINEIMYHPISGNEDDEYVELLNRSAAPVNVGNWRFVDGIDFALPANTVIPAGGYLVVAKNAQRLRTNYANLQQLNTVGDFQGQLANGGERLALARPSDPANPYRDFVVVDEVTYGDGGRWGRWADGGGSSLELIDPRNDRRQPASWGDSDESARSAWTTVESTGFLDHGTADYPVNRLQILLMGEGECLLDEVEVIGPGGRNLVPNPSFEAGADGWRMRGTHTRSGLETTEGYRSRQSLHLRASERGGTEANHVYTDLLGSLDPGSSATLRAKVRWLRGNPEILLRLRGNYLEAAGRMELPVNLGTPGASNSIARANTGPAIFEVLHTPILPAFGQPVLVSARATDPDGVLSVRLKYRVDPLTEPINVPMTDDGTGGDELAGDGVYSAQIPARSTTNLVAFYVEATDTAWPRGVSTFPSEAPARECLVRWGESQPFGNLGAYRIWLTQATLNEWSSREPSSNDPLGVTFVYGNCRAVYNATALYSGSPFHWMWYDSPIGQNCTYVLHFPSDDLFLGTGDFVLNMPSNMGSDIAAQREQFFYWMAAQLGQPYTYRRFCHVYVNGVKRGSLYEDAQQPNRDYIEQWFPDDPDGELYKIEDWFDYDDDFRSFFNQDATLGLFLAPDGEKKVARYRWNWRKRAVRDSAHDFSQLFELVDALNTPDPRLYAPQVEAVADVEEWMRAFALRHIVGDWDAYGYRRGKNMYAYKPPNGKWQLFHWDVAFAFGLGDGPTHNLFDASHFDGTVDTVSARMYNQPAFRRAYLRACDDAAQGPLQATNAAPVLQEKYQALTDNQIYVANPASILSWVGSRRKNLLDVLATNAASFAVVSNDPSALIVTGRNLFTLQGTAPVRIKDLRVNGIAYPVAWETVTAWKITLPLKSGENLLAIQGYDSWNRPIREAATTLSVRFLGADQRPEDHLVISEIMYHPAMPDTAFVEVHNTSQNYAFDLTNYRLRGTDFTFPEGTILRPGAFLVAVNDRRAFTATYGINVPIAGQFRGRLRNDGETLSLVKLGSAPDTDVVVDQVTYEDLAPWPAAADGQGPSLQLVDAGQDNRRPANWVAVVNDPAGGAVWKFASVTGTASSSILYINLVSSGEVYLDDVWLARGTIPESGGNLIKNGDFEKVLTGTWTVSATDPDTKRTTALKHGGTNCLHIVSTTGGNIFLPSVLQTNLMVVMTEVYTLSFWYRASTTGGGLTIGLFGSDIEKTVSIAPATVTLPTATPGAANVTGAAVGVLPPLWINELLPNNVSGPTDAAGDRDPWVELLNAGAEPTSLDGLYLTDDPAEPFKWAFPAGAALSPGGFLVIWLDGEPGESTPAEPHAAFRLDASAGVIVLVLKDNGQPRVLDYLRYQGIPQNRSVGSFPDGDPHARQVFHFSTPGLPNTNAVAPLPVFINEWMARNRATIPDPVDQDFDDWFELYNPGDFTVDLSGYTLTDDLNTPAEWRLPTGTAIPPRGFLLIWADNEIDQNAFNQGLHAGFRLDQGGDTIALFAPNGSLVDAVTFGPQQSDVSQGRYPDGALAAFGAMTTPTPGRPNQMPADWGPIARQLTITAHGVTTVWAVQTGRTYQLQFKNDLNELNWQNVGPTVMATDAELALTDEPPSAVTQRFYRLVEFR
jgi:hypothetical protein